VTGRESTASPRQQPILVTGAGGNIGGVATTVVERLRRQDIPVRAFVRREGERAEALRATGAEVVVGDLTRAPDLVSAIDGCRRMFFSMSVSAQYLEATATVGAVATGYGRLEALVNISQMTVSQMDLTSTAESRQHRLQWLSEKVLDWSGLPVTHVRPTMFMENPLLGIFAVASIVKDDTIRLPFGSGRTSPVAADDVADVVATVLADPSGHIGRTYELTGRTSRDLSAIAAEFSEALGRPISYLDVPFDDWYRELAATGLPDHVVEHLATMARLHRMNRYDRSTDHVEAITGRPASTIADFVEKNSKLFEQVSTG